MPLLAASHIKFVYNIQLQLQHSSFLSAKIIQKHTDTHYSSVFKCILFIFIMRSKVIEYYNDISCTCTFKIYSQYIINHYIMVIINPTYNKFLSYNHTLCL